MLRKRMCPLVPQDDAAVRELGERPADGFRRRAAEVGDIAACLQPFDAIGRAQVLCHLGGNSAIVSGLTRRNGPTWIHVSTYQRAGAGLVPRWLHRQRTGP